MSMSARLLAVLLVFAPCSAARAQTAQQRAEARTNALAAEAREDFRKAEDYEARGDNQNACTAFRNAAAEYQNANWANMGMLTEIGSGGQYDKDVVLQNGRLLGGNSQAADARAKAVCGKPNALPPVSSGSGSYSGGSSSTYTSSRPAMPNMDAQVAALQATLDSGHARMMDALRQYTARDFVGACISARASVTTFAKAQGDARAIVKATTSFRDLTMRDLDGVDRQFNRASYDAEDFYCAK